jgi:hypothetical protein
MLVIHWAKQNQTHRILRPTCRRRRPWGGHGAKRPVNPKGVYVFPFSRNAVANGTWRRHLKLWGRGKGSGNMNGFVFRLQQGDFPLYASNWEANRAAFTLPEDRELQEICICQSMDDLVARCAKAGFADIDVGWDDDFEIIVPRHVDARRIIKVIRERPQPERGLAAD